MLFKSLIVMLLLACCLRPCQLLACNYNVRDIGFSELRNRPYYLFWYVSRQTEPEIVRTIQKVSSNTLSESNVKAEIVNIENDGHHSAIKYIEALSIKSFPAAVLVSPDNQILRVSIPQPDPSFSNSLASAVEEIISSPKRKEIVEQVLNTFAAVLLIEGTDSQANMQASDTINNAIKVISRQMKTMPKAIANAPVMIVVKQMEFPREKFLLWSLGLDAKTLTQPHVAILYGRVRRMGPVISGEDLTQDRLISLLYLIGADCECGLDRKWMQGPVLPVRWDQTVQSRVAKILRFDPENPMIKTEMDQILRQGPNTGSTIVGDSFPGVTFGYQEFAMVIDPCITGSEDKLRSIQINPPPLQLQQSKSAKAVEVDDIMPAGKLLRNLLYCGAGLAFVTIIASGVIIVRIYKNK
jgi:hypothetical protein